MEATYYFETWFNGVHGVISQKIKTLHYHRCQNFKAYNKYAVLVYLQGYLFFLRAKQILQKVTLLLKHVAWAGNLTVPQVMCMITHNKKHQLITHFGRCPAAEHVNKYGIFIVGFEVLTPVVMKCSISRDITPCSALTFIDVETCRIYKKTPWSESASELHRQSDRRLSANWLPTFADKGCHVVSLTDPHGRSLDFLDRSRYFSIK
jgi:hypothetical protein